MFPLSPPHRYTISERNTSGPSESSHGTLHSTQDHPLSMAATSVANTLVCNDNLTKERAPPTLCPVSIIQHDDAGPSEPETIRPLSHVHEDPLSSRVPEVWKAYFWLSSRISTSCDRRVVTRAASECFGTGSADMKEYATPTNTICYNLRRRKHNLG
jgi:hypothetical protein